MDAERLRDRISRGMGHAARVTGDRYDLFRPRDAACPLAAGNRILQLPVVLDGGYPGYRRPRGYERALRGAFDSVGVQVGDYLKGSRGVLFVAALPPLLRPLCVLTNAVVDVIRVGGPASAGLNGYGGAVEEVIEPVLSQWPAQMLSEGSAKGGLLPVDSGATGWSLILPPTPAAIACADLIQDVNGRRYVVRAVEHTELGWRLSVRGTEV